MLQEQPLLLQDQQDIDAKVWPVTILEHNTDPADDYEKPRTPRIELWRRLRSFLLCCQHMRRKASARRLELRRRFMSNWNSQGCPFTYRKMKPAKPRFASCFSSCFPCSADYALAELHGWRKAAQWVVDSGCSVHCTPSVNDLTHVDYTGSDRPLKVADKRNVTVTHTGRIDVPVEAIAPDGTVTQDFLRLSRVLVVPSFRNRLFSCSAGRRQDSLRTVLDGDHGLTGYIELPSGNKLYFDGDPKRYEFHVAMQADGGSGDGLLNHRRLAHFSSERLRASGMQSGHDPLDCEACCLNLKRQGFSTKSRVQRGKAPLATKFGQRINSDTLAMPSSIEGYSYIMVFVDEASEASPPFTFFAMRWLAPSCKPCRATMLSTLT